MNSTTSNKEENPLVTYILFSYNQGEYIEEALNSAYAQTYSPLQIIISDDFSTDDSMNLVKKSVANYSGNHEILINAHDSNIGMARHLNQVIPLAKGELIIFAAADDISYPHRTATIYNEWTNSGKLYKCIFSNVMLIDEKGMENGKIFNEIPDYSKSLLDFISKSRAKSYFKLKNIPKCWSLGCSAAITKSVFDIYGPLDQNILQEDGALSFRALLHGEIKYIDQVLMKYRRHSTNAFQPQNVHKVLHLLKSEFFYKSSWLKDALLTNSKNKELINIVKRDVDKAAFKQAFYGIPVIGIGILKCKGLLRTIIRSCLKKNKRI